MKIFIILIGLFLFSCNNEDKDLKKANALIDSLNKARYEDSIRIDAEMQIEIARKKLEKATGKKDTLTNAERLKKAEKDFKQP